MLKKSITYEDYNGNKRTEDFFFHLNEAEIIDWLTTSDDITLDGLLDGLSKQNNRKIAMRFFRELIYRSYGEKDPEGRKFRKTQEVKDEFMETEAYSVLYMELLSDSKEAADFFNGVLPKDLSEKINGLFNDPNKMQELPESVREYALQIKQNTENTTNITQIK